MVFKGNVSLQKAGSRCYNPPPFCSEMVFVTIAAVIRAY